MPNDLWGHCNKMEVRKACIPAGNGHFTARALAKMYAALAGDGSINGIRLVSPGRISHMQRLVTDRADIVILGMTINRSIGFILGGKRGEEVTSLGPRKTAFGHTGAGGSVAFADPEVGLAIAVTLNKMELSMVGGREFDICDLIRRELDVA